MRLTKRHNGDFAYWNGNGDFTTKKRYDVLLDRLAEYEDTGLTAEEIKVLAEWKSGRLGVEDYFKLLRELKETQDALNELRQEIEPKPDKPKELCKTGDTAYWVYPDIHIWVIDTCRYIGVCANGEHVIQTRNSLRTWTHVFATHAEAKEYAKKRGVERSETI